MVRSIKLTIPSLLLSVLLGSFCIYVSTRPPEHKVPPKQVEYGRGVATASYVEGLVEVFSRGLWTRVKKGDLLESGDAIRTGEDGRIELLLGSAKGRVRLDRRTEFDVWGIRKGKKWISTGGRVATGSAWAHINSRADENSFVLETPAVKAVAKGTIYRVHVVTNDSVEVSVYKGAAEASFLMTPSAGGEEIWGEQRLVSAGQAITAAPGRAPQIVKIDLREDWSDGWQQRRVTSLGSGEPLVEHVEVRRSVIRDLQNLNSDLYLSVEVALTGWEGESNRFRAEEAHIRKIKIRAYAWDRMNPEEKVRLLNETYLVLKQRYPNITNSVVLEFDDNRPDLALRYGRSLKG